MIKLTKGLEPEVLVERGAAWTAVWVDHVENGTGISEADKTRYRHQDIKAAILLETCEKCAYCESKVTHVYPGDVEHIAPKFRRPDLFVAWHNLTLGCKTCNVNKGDYYDEDEPLINPYVDDPSEHLKLHGPLVMNAPGSNMGERTTLRLKLSRPALVERRQERIAAVKTLIDKWAAQPEGELKSLMLDEIRSELGHDREYAGTLRVFAYHHAGIEANGIEGG